MKLWEEISGAPWGKPWMSFAPTVIVEKTKTPPPSKKDPLPVRLAAIEARAGELSPYRARQLERIAMARIQAQADKI